MITSPLLWMAVGVVVGCYGWLRTDEPYGVITMVVGDVLQDRDLDMEPGQIRSLVTSQGLGGASSLNAVIGSVTGSRRLGAGKDVLFAQDVALIDTNGATAPRR